VATRELGSERSERASGAGHDAATVKADDLRMVLQHSLIVTAPIAHFIYQDYLNGSIIQKGDHMKRLLVIVMILSLLFALGCAKQAEIVSEPAAPAPVPDMGQVQPGAQEEVVTPPAPETVPAPATQVASEYTSGQSEPALVDDTGAPLGSRSEGTEKTAVDESVSEGAEEIMLFANKTMSMKDITVKAGTALAWKNYDSWPHQLAVETGSGWDTVRHAESTRLLEGNVWEYTFEEKGTFLVRDIYSGPMRMTVTVE
jgi:plastocyanin